MTTPFKHLAVALTLSPTGHALLQEARRLRDLFHADLRLIHVGKRDEDESRLKEIVRQGGLDVGTLEIIRQGRDPANAILRRVKEENVDLLIVGALEKENMLRFYLGSVARTLMRRSPCSVLFFTKPSDHPRGFKSIYVFVEFTTTGENTVRAAQQLALLEEAEELHLLRDFYIPGLSLVSEDARSTEAGRQLRFTTQREERQMMEMFVRGLNLKGVKLSMVSLYGKEGWETSNYVREHRADLYVVPAPEREPKLLDRLFPSSLEFVFERLPSNVLLVKGGA
ncbi:universal stress protein [bacterium]|nr:MAG: universal stress protein [bacterium]